MNVFPLGPSQVYGLKLLASLSRFLRDWTPCKVFIGTGDPDEPEIIDTLALPKFWVVKVVSR